MIPLRSFVSCLLLAFDLIAAALGGFRVMRPVGEARIKSDRINGSASRGQSIALTMVCWSALVLAPAVHAGPIIISQPVDPTHAGFISDFGGLPVPSQQAGDFVLSGPAVLGSLLWWGGYDGNVPQPDNFTVRLFNDDGTGLPQVDPFFDAAPVNLMRGDTGLIDPDGAHLNLYTADLASGVALSAGTTYYLSIVNSTGTGDWFWAVADGTGANFLRDVDGASWQAFQDGSQAFELIAAVPEPPTPMLLAIVALAAVAGAWRRRRCATVVGRCFTSGQ